MTKKMKKAKHEPMRLEVGGESAPASSVPDQQPPSLRAGRAPLRAGRASKVMQAPRCLPRIQGHISPRNPTWVAGRIMSQRERTHKYSSSLFS